MSKCLLLKLWIFYLATMSHLKLFMLLYFSKKRREQILSGGDDDKCSHTVCSSVTLPTQRVSPALWTASDLYTLNAQWRKQLKSRLPEERFQITLNEKQEAIREQGDHSGVTGRENC